MRLQPPPPTPWRLVHAVASWPVTSQQVARRNALVASTALTAKRKERRDVEDFLAARLGAADLPDALAVPPPPRRQPEPAAAPPAARRPAGRRTA